MTTKYSEPVDVPDSDVGEADVSPTPASKKKYVLATDLLVLADIL